MTSEYTQLGRLKIEMLGVKKEIEEKMLELGGRTYELYKISKLDDFARSQQINQLFLDIADLEDELQNYDNKWKQIKESQL